MHFALVPFILSSPLATHALSLGDALRYQAGASQFAQRIESDAALLALAQSNTLTVFAPADSNCTLASLRRRETVNEQNSYQLQPAFSSLQSLGRKPGEVLVTLNNVGNLNGASQVAVAHPADPRIISPNPRTRRTIGNLTVKTVTISSGLGNNVSIIRGDILYDGGIIQVVDE